MRSIILELDASILTHILQLPKEAELVSANMSVSRLGIVELKFKNIGPEAFDGQVILRSTGTVEEIPAFKMNWPL